MSESNSSSSRCDIYANVTKRIIDQLERGQLPWIQRWKGDAAPRPLRANGIPYKGINVILLWMEAALAGFTSPYWFTATQVKKRRAQIREGEKVATIVHIGAIRKKGVDRPIW